ncbi:MAG TPA: SseB family protein [Jatrophihabitantaceae bacterium]
MQAWQPADLFEERLLQASTADDAGAAAAVLQAAQLCLPLTGAAAAGDEAPVWPTVSAADQTWIIAYTSIESMHLGSGGALEHARATSLPELAAGWPDHSWALVINPGLPVQVTLDAAALARVAAPSLLEDRAAQPTARTPMMQKLLRHADVHHTLQFGVTRVSGYCHQLVDVAHIAAPEGLVEALGRKNETAELITDQGSVNVLRWPAVGLELYRNAFGGIDEASRAAVNGWLIEEPPFVGLGFVPSADQLIREYKVDGVGLPHGAEICELTATGTAETRALLDVDLAQWLLIVPSDPPDFPDSARAGNGS